MSDDESQWITTTEAVEISGYNLEHIRRLTRSGKVRGRKFGILWQVDHLSLMDYLKEAKGSDDGRRGPHLTK